MLRWKIRYARSNAIGYYIAIMLKLLDKQVRMHEQLLQLLTGNFAVGLW